MKKLPTSGGVALFPGAFKPPHRAHICAIDYILNTVGVDKLVIIVSNRCRHVPETNCAIDAETAVALLQDMLTMLSMPMHRIDIVVATHRAVDEVTDYVSSASDAESLLFCAGQEDLESGDARFVRACSLAAERGTSARILALPVGTDSVHSSDLRSVLGGECAGPAAYISALPRSLPLRDRLALWDACRRRLRPVHDIVRPKVLHSLRRRYEFDDSSLTIKDSSAIDPVFLLQQESEGVVVVKYGGDTVGATTFGDAGKPSPARRVSVEKRAVKYLGQCLDKGIFPTRVDYFDRELRLLALSGRPVGATAVASCQPSYDIVRQCGAVLASIHACSVPDSGFWGSFESDRCHWRQLADNLEARALAAARRFNVDVNLLRAITRADILAATNILHLDFQPDNLYCLEGRVTVEHLERASTYGDPTYDVATFIVAILKAGVDDSTIEAGAKRAAAFARAYAVHAKGGDEILVRATGFVLMLLLATPAVSGFSREYSNLAVRIIELGSGAEMPAVTIALRLDQLGHVSK